MPRRDARGAGPGQECGSNRLCVGHWLDAQPETGISFTLSLEEHRLAGSTRCPTPSRQGELLDFKRQVITHHDGRLDAGASDRLEARSGRVDARLIAPTDEFVGVWIPRPTSLWSLSMSGILWIPRVRGCPDSLSEREVRGCLDSPSIALMSCTLSRSVNAPELTIVSY